MSEQEQDLTPTMQELMVQMARMQTELNELKARSEALPQPIVQAKPQVSTTRRKLLRRLAAGLVAGLAVGGIGATLPQSAQAKFVSAKGWGAIVMPPGGTLYGNAPTGTVYGLYATSDASTDISGYPANYKIGVVGLNTETDGLAHYGVLGQANDVGVYGKATGVGGTGVYGYCVGDSAKAVYAQARGQNGYGIEATCQGSNGRAVHAVDITGDTMSYAGYFFGKVVVTETLTKPAGSFKIDHPLDPANKYLYHSFVESPDMMNIYNGIVTLDNQGEATVEMPDWFEALNFDFRYQLTSIGTGSPNLHIAEKLKDRKFKIAGGQLGQEISWQVTGIRQDAYAKAHRIPVEEDKLGDEKGKYFHPELFGQPKEMSVHSRSVAAK